MVKLEAANLKSKSFGGKFFFQILLHFFNSYWYDAILFYFAGSLTHKWHFRFDCILILFLWALMHAHTSRTEMPAQQIKQNPSTGNLWDYIKSDRQLIIYVIKRLCYFKLIILHYPPWLHVIIAACAIRRTRIISATIIVRITTWINKQKRLSIYFRMNSS